MHKHIDTFIILPILTRPGPRRGTWEKPNLQYRTRVKQRTGLNRQFIHIGFEKDSPE